MNRAIFDKVEKELRRLPDYVVVKLMAWAASVEMKGRREVRKIPGYHDEPLKGWREGQRSIRLTRSYRAIYKEEINQSITLIVVEEVNKHEY